MTYKFTLNESHYNSLHKYQVKSIKKFALIFVAFFYILFFYGLLQIFFHAMELNKLFNYGSVTLNYVVSIIFIIVFSIFLSMLFYKWLMKLKLSNLRFLPYLAKAKYTNESELIVKESSLILKSYGYSIEIPKSNITKIEEVNNIILVFNKSKSDILILPREVIKIEYLK